MRSRDGRTKDLSFHWLTKHHGIQWDAWRLLAAEWFAQLDSGLEGHRKNIAWFLEQYLIGHNLPADPKTFLAQSTVRPSLFDCVEAVLEPNNAPRRHNDIVDFIDWIIALKFTEGHSDGKLKTFYFSYQAFVNQLVFIVMDDQMQLLAGNALMRAMAQQANPNDWELDGLKRVCGLIKTGRSLSEYGLLASGLKALQLSWKKPVVLLKELLSSPNSTPLKLVQSNG